MKIYKEDRNLVLFMALGDGYISKSGSLSIRHSIKQQDYLLWKKRLLEKHHIKTSEVSYKDNNGYGAYEFYTKTYDFIKLFRKILYTPKKKIFNKKIFNKITPLGLYIWYLDDGCLSKKKRNGKVIANELIINTMLSKEENQIIIDCLKEKFNISFKQQLNHGLYRLSCGTKEARKFLKIIEEYKNEVPSMLYKFDVKPESYPKGVKKG